MSDGRSRTSSRAHRGGITRVVGLGPLILFSTDTGDAWLLDWQDERALCLARGGTPQKVNIVETENDFAIEWTSDYRITGDVMTLQDGTGKVDQSMATLRPQYCRPHNAWREVEGAG